MERHFLFPFLFLGETLVIFCSVDFLFRFPNARKEKKKKEKQCTRIVISTREFNLKNATEKFFCVPFTLYSLTIHPFLGQFRIPFFRTLFYIFYVRFFLFFFFLRCEKESKEIERRDSIERYTNRGFNNYSRLLSEIVRSSRSRFSLERRNSSNYSIYKSNRRFCWTRFISHGRICF